MTFGTSVSNCGRCVTLQGFVLGDTGSASNRNDGNSERDAGELPLSSG